jgi:chaperonin GroES
VGLVVEVGPGEGQGEDRTPLSVKKGDKVMYGKYSGTEVQDQGKDYLIVRESDILAVVS